MKKFLLVIFAALLAFSTSSCVEEHSDVLVDVSFTESANGDVNIMTYLTAQGNVRAVFNRELDALGENMSNTHVVRDGKVNKVTRQAKNLAEKAFAKIDPSDLKTLAASDKCLFEVTVYSVADIDNKVVAWSHDFTK